jgi:hypothetical protein
MPAAIDAAAIPAEVKPRLVMKELAARRIPFEIPKDIINLSI